MKRKHSLMRHCVACVSLAESLQSSLNATSPVRLIHTDHGHPSALPRNEQDQHSGLNPHPKLTRQDCTVATYRPRAPRRADQVYSALRVDGCCSHVKKLQDYHHTALIMETGTGRTVLNLQQEFPDTNLPTPSWAGECCYFHNTP